MIRNLLDELVDVAGGTDPRFGCWAKTVDAVLPQHDDGYMFAGKFVAEGTVEVQPERRLFLVMTTHGSRKRQQRHYQIIEMGADGTLRPTAIQTDGQTRGWALRLRDQVVAKLDEIDVAPAPLDAAAVLRDLAAWLARLGRENIAGYLAVPPEMREMIEAYADQEATREL